MSEFVKGHGNSQILRTFWPVNLLSTSLNQSKKKKKLRAKISGKNEQEFLNSDNFENKIKCKTLAL